VLLVRFHVCLFSLIHRQLRSRLPSKSSRNTIGYGVGVIVDVRVTVGVKAIVGLGVIEGIIVALGIGVLVGIGAGVVGLPQAERTKTVRTTTNKIFFIAETPFRYFVFFCYAPCSYSKGRVCVSTGSTTRLCLGRKSALCWVGFVVEDIYHNDTNYPPDFF